MLTEKFFRLAMGAASRDVETTILDIVESLDLDPQLGILDRISALNDALVRANLKIRPELTTGDLDTVRLVGVVRTGPADSEIDSDILSSENSFVEFKASLCFDYARYQARPDTPPKDLSNEGITFASLKTIAAFLNSSGGRLLVGIRDDGSVCGLENDYPFCKTQSRDGWELKLRDLIKGRFYEGDMINNYITAAFMTKNGSEICRILVVPRTKMSLLLSGTRYCLFVRQGNRTAELGLEQVEEFLSGRKAK
jgi:hypothetical protein